MSVIQGIYIALFGRPADPGGLAYWNEVTKNGADLSEMLRVLPATEEYTSRFEGQTPDQVITSIYLALFNREPDPEGLAFFKEQLASGAQNMATIAVNILQGAQGDDKADIEAKVEAAELFTASLDTEAEIEAYKGADAAALAKKFIDTVDKDNKPTADAVEKAADAVAAGQDPTGGQAPVGGGGGGGGGGGTVTPTPAYDTDYVDTLGANIDGQLYAGKGNPASGFAVAVNEKAGIELALDVRYRNDPTDIAPGTPDDLARAHDLRFAYSVAQDGGIDLSNYTYTLEIDVDPTDAAQWVTFQLRDDPVADTHTFNVSNSRYDWVQVDQNGNEIVDGKSITDDGGNDSVSQNIQAIHWYTGGNLIQDGGLYDIRLTATNKLGQIEAQTAIQINPVLADDYAVKIGETKTANADGKLYAGSGNSADGFQIVALKNGMELALGGRIAHGGPNAVQAPVDGVVTVDSGTNIRFAYSVSGLEAADIGGIVNYNPVDGTYIKSPTDKGNYIIELSVDVNPSATATTFMTWTLADLNQPNLSDIPGTNNAAGDSNYVWLPKQSGQLPIVDDGGNASVTQNIQTPFWLDGTPEDFMWEAGHYNVRLDVYNQDAYGNKVALIGSNEVIFNVQPIAT